MIILRQRTFSYEKGVTKYDRTDNIKRMKDSDILAEEEKSNAGTYVKSGKSALVGSALGAALGAVAGSKSGRAGIKKGAAAGAAAGAILGGSAKLAGTHKEREQNRFVNRRLREAKKQARRRESRDWKDKSVIDRESYS